MNINNDMTVGEMAAKEHKVIPIFKELGIDFCCGGNKNLKEALKEINITPEGFIEKLENFKKEVNENAETNYMSMNPEALAEYIEYTHHEFLKKALPQTNELLAKVLKAHGVRHPELFEVFKLFGTLKTDIEQHLIKEETMLFPRIKDLNKEEVQKIAREIKREHELAGELLGKLRTTTYNYNLPEDACMSYKDLYSSMKYIEEDLHEHIHLENNILLKNIV